MPSNYTKNHQLSQWEKSDRVLMEDFNADNAKIDTALKAEAGARAAADSAINTTLAAHTADITKRGNCQIYTTSYVGNGKYGQANPNTLTFSRSPMIVLITDINNSSTMILFRGCTRTCHLAGRYASILTWNSGTASWWSPSSSFEQMNDSDVTYHVVALLPMD